MDIELLDGTVVTGVPDNVNKADIYAKLRAKGFTDDQIGPSPATAPASEIRDPLSAVTNTDLVEGTHPTANLVTHPELAKLDTKLSAGMPAPAATPMPAPVPPPAAEPSPLERTKAKLAEQGGGSNPWGDLMTGSAASIYKTMKGVQKALPFLPTPLLPMPSDAQIKEWEGQADKTTMGKVGQVGADIGQQMFSSPKLLANALTGGTFEALQNPEDPMSSFVKGAGGSIIGQKGLELAGRAGTELLSRAIPATQDTLKLLREGVVPTLGRGADPNTVRGRAVESIENLAERSRLTRGAVEAQRAQGDEQLMEAAMKRVGLPVPPKTLPNSERVHQMRQTLDQQYKDIYKGVEHVPDPKFSTGLRDLAKAHNLGTQDARNLKRVLENSYFSRIKRGKLGAKDLDDLRGVLREEMSKAPDTAKAAYIDAIQQVDKQLTGELSKAGKDLTKLDAMRAELYPIERALKTNVKETPMTAEQYNRATRQNATAIGKSPLDPNAPGASLSGPAARVMSKPMKEANVVADMAMIGPGFLPALALRGGAWLTDNPQFRALLMGDAATKAKALRNLTTSQYNKLVSAIGAEKAQGESDAAQ